MDLPRRDPGPSYGGVGPSYGRVWSLKSLRFQGPRAVNGASGWDFFGGAAEKSSQLGILQKEDNQTVSNPFFFVANF